MHINTDELSHAGSAARKNSVTFCKSRRHGTGVPPTPVDRMIPTCMDAALFNPASRHETFLAAAIRNSVNTHKLHGQTVSMDSSPTDKGHMDLTSTEPSPIITTTHSRAPRHNGSRTLALKDTCATEDPSPSTWAGLGET